MHSLHPHSCSLAAPHSEQDRKGRNLWLPQGIHPADNTQPKLCKPSGLTDWNHRDQHGCNRFCSWRQLTKAPYPAQRTQPFPEALSRLSLWVARALHPMTAQEEVTTNFICLCLTQHKFLQIIKMLAKPNLLILFLNLPRFYKERSGTLNNWIMNRFQY